MAKQSVKVEYTRYPGIVTRIIRDVDFEGMGVKFPTQEFSVEQGYAKDASDWPAKVVEYFESDDEFTVTKGDATPASSPQGSPQA